MATFEERLTAIEREQVELKQDNAALKEKMELQTVAIGGLVNKALLERIIEKNDTIFQALIAHDDFTNRQLSELRERMEVQVEGKIAGLQTGMRQRFEQQDSRITGLQTLMDARFEQQDGRITGLQTEMQQRFEQQDKHIADVRGELTVQGQKLDQVLLLLNTLTSKPEQEE